MRVTIKNIPGGKGVATVKWLRELSRVSSPSWSLSLKACKDIIDRVYHGHDPCGVTFDVPEYAVDRVRELEASGVDVTCESSPPVPNGYVDLKGLHDAERIRYLVDECNRLRRYEQAVTDIRRLAAVALPGAVQVPYGTGIDPARKLEKFAQAQTRKRKPTL